MKESKNIPEIRFEGFEGEWEEKKLGNLGSIAMNKRIYKDQTSEEGDVPFFKIGTFRSEPDAFISKSLFDDYKTRFPYPSIGDILISASGSIGRTIEYTGKDEYFQDSNIVWLQHNGNIENSFLKYFYSIVEWSGLEGSTIKRLYNKNILNTKISLPSKKEQTQIGTFFQKLDKQITLEQQKHDKLVTLKKAMLEKMFPKEGSSVPEIRFEVFEGEWEEKKMSEVADFSKGHSYSKNDIVEVGTPIILYGRLYTKYQLTISEVDTFVVEKPGSIYSTGNEVIVPASGETAEDIAIGSAILEPGIIFGGDLNIIYPNSTIDSQFLALSISHSKQHKELSKKAQGKSIVHLRNADIMQTTLNYPSKKEQSQIGSYFQNLDKLISLQQQKIDKLKNIKKACLEKMFV